MTVSRMTRLALLLAAVAFTPSGARAQRAVQRPGPTPGTPCCTITAIDLRTGRVSAQMNASKRIFEFLMTDRAQLMKLRVGQPIFANFTTSRVSVNGIEPCCGIVGVPPAQEPSAAPPPSAKSDSKPTTTSNGGSFNSMKVDITTVTPNEGTTMTAIRGRLSADSDNARGETDRHSIVPTRRTIVATSPHSLGKSRRLMDDPAIGEYVKIAVWALKGFEIKSALLAGHKYMISNCLGIKVKAGEFALIVPDPDLRVVSDGLVLTFTIAHVAMNAFSIRLRPDLTDANQPCHFSGAVAVGGGADNVRYEMHFNPVLDLEQCKIGSMGMVHQVWRIGTLHLDPLPSAVSNLAADMIEDSLTAFANFNLTDRIVAALNGAAGSQCHT